MGPRIAATLVLMGFLASCGHLPKEAGDAKASSRYIFWRPAPVVDAVDASEVVAKAPQEAWREIDADNLLIMELVDGSRVAIELAPDFAPIHIANMKALARASFWTGASIYRVQDNYVAQWGQNDTDRPLPPAIVKSPPAEYDRPLTSLEIRPFGYPDSYAPMVGHAAGWPIAYDPERGRAWLTHCYGSVGVGRDMHPDTGMGGELYAVIGHAPRHLDRNIAVVGRVIDGIQHLSARPRGTESLGFYKDKSQYIPIKQITLAADMPETGRPRYEVMRTDHPTFSDYVTGRANRTNAFYILQHGGVDLCNALVPVRKKA